MKDTQLELENINQSDLLTYCINYFRKIINNYQLNNLNKTIL